MKDEIIDGILKKGYLTKRGHKRKNWKRRWFILEKTVVKYFENKENKVQKVRKCSLPRPIPSFPGRGSEAKEKLMPTYLIVKVNIVIPLL